MASILWTAIDSAETVLSTGLDALAVDARAISAAISNDASSTERRLFALCELAVTFGTAPTAGRVVRLYVLPSLDTTNFEDGDASVQPPDTAWIASSPVRAVTSAQRLFFRGFRHQLPVHAIELPPGEFKLLVQNSTDQAFSASGHTLKIARYGFDVV